jgi:hypothetical protein
MTHSNGEHSPLPITEWLLDAVIGFPEDQGFGDVGSVAYFATVAVPLTAVAGIGGFALDEVHHYVVEPVMATAEFVNEVIAGERGDTPLVPNLAQPQQTASPGDGGATHASAPAPPVANPPGAQFNMADDAAQREFNMEQDAAAGQHNMANDTNENSVGSDTNDPGYDPTWSDGS